MVTLNFLHTYVKLDMLILKFKWRLNRQKIRNNSETEEQWGWCGDKLYHMLNSIIKLE